MLQDRHIDHDGQECQQREDDEVFGPVGKRSGILLVFVVREDDGLVGITEGLRKQRHHHRDLDAPSINAQLDRSLLARHQLGQQDLVGHLVEHAHKTEQQQRPGIDQHLLRQPLVETVRDAPHLRNEEEGNQRRTDQVRQENKPHAVVALDEEVMQSRGIRHHEEDEEVEQDARNDEGELQRDEAQGPLLLPQAAEHHGLERVLNRDQHKDADILGVGCIAHGAGDRAQQQEDGGQEEEAHAAHHPEGVAVDHLVVHAGLAAIAEQGRLHAEGQQRKEQRRVGVQVRDDAIAPTLHGNDVGVGNHQQVIQEPADDAAQAVERRVFRETFQIHTVTKITKMARSWRAI